MPTYESVLVLIGSALARPVGVAVVDLGARASAGDAALDPGGVGKLAAIVAGDRLEDQREHFGADFLLEGVEGIDYSPVSVEKAQEVNRQAIREGRCTVLQGSVADMLFADDWFDMVTAFETVYFWPDLPRCFREVFRVLKSGGTFLICNECSDPVKDSKWPEIINGMTVYRDTQLKDALEQAGFRDVQTRRNRMGWLCVTARK